MKHKIKYGKYMVDVEGETKKRESTGVTPAVSLFSCSALVGTSVEANSVTLEANRTNVLLFWEAQNMITRENHNDIIIFITVNCTR